ncbi:Aminoglycoside/hydroxyurea antibiotic resistance kinase [compost metagenome]
MSSFPPNTLLQAWRLTPEGPPLETHSGRLIFASSGGDPVVLKQPHPHGDEAGAWRSLRHYAGRGAVSLRARSPDGIVLMERAVPGTALTTLVMEGRDDEAMVIVCEVAAALHRVELPTDPFPCVEDWGCGFKRYRASGDTTLPGALVERAEALFEALAVTQGKRHLLHADLHHDNIVFDARRGWLAIDPKGVIGEPAYELGAALRNPTEDPTNFAVTSLVARRVRLAAERTGIDSERILGWAFAQAVLSAIWSIEDGVSPARGVSTAKAIQPLLPA